MAQSPSGNQVPADNGNALRLSPQADASHNNAPFPGTREAESAQINKECDDLTQNVLFDEVRSHAGNQDLVSNNRRSSRSPQAVPRHDLTLAQDIPLPPRPLRRRAPRSSISGCGSYDPDGRVHPDRQKLLRNDGPLSHSPQVTPHQDMTLAPDGSLDTQAEGSVSIVSLQEHNRVSSSPRALPQPPQELKAKRSFDQITSRSPSPSHVRIKLEEESSPEPDVSSCSTGSNSNFRDTTENDGRYFDPILDPVPVGLGKASRVTTWDPQGNGVGWQILCLGASFGRRKICGYLCFSDTAQMRTWEESDPKRWKYIESLSSLTRAKIELTDVLQIICNDGGALATKVAAYMERLEPWVWHKDDNEDFRQHTVTVAAITKISVGLPHLILRVGMAIVWLIRSSPAQFRGSGTFDTPYFWYAPEDVSRAYWYLNNLRCNPREREREGTKPAKIARPMRTGTDAGLSSLHNSVSEGEWAGRFLRKDIVSKQEKIPEKQSEDTVRPGVKINRWGEKTGQWRNKAEIRSEDMAAQLLRLRTWSYNTYPFDIIPDETELDRLMDLARVHTKPQTRNIDVYRSACMEVELFVWAKSHPSILDDRSKYTFADFKTLLSWLHARDIAVGDDDRVAGLMEDAVKAVVAADRGVYNGKKAAVKEMVYMADLGMGEV